MNALICSLILLSIATAQTDARPPISAVERVYATIVSSRFASVGEGWTRLDQKELPKAFEDGHPLSDSSHQFNQRRFVSGYRLTGSNTVILFEFEKPRLVADLEFCRSRVNVYQLYNFDASRGYASQVATSLEDFRELISFEAGDVETRCAAASLQDLEHYIFISNRLSDYDLLRLWNRFLTLVDDDEKSRCSLRDDALLEQIGITRSGELGAKNAYFFFVHNNDGRIKVVLRPDGPELAIASCEEGILD